MSKTVRTRPWAWECTEKEANTPEAEIALIAQTYPQVLYDATAANAKKLLETLRWEIDCHLEKTQKTGEFVNGLSELTMATEYLCKALAILKDGDFDLNFEVIINLAIGSKKTE